MSKYHSKHGSYELGTQEDLDAAKDDATKLPFDTVFIYDQQEFVRSVGIYDDEDGVKMFQVDNDWRWGYLEAEDLLPAKQPKQKKPKAWQNGTQAHLGAAINNAKLIPKKTYFLSTYGVTKGKIVYRIDNAANAADSVMMFANHDCSSDFHSADDLEPIE